MHAVITAVTPQVRTLADITPLAPELLVVLGAFALLMLDLFLDERRRIVTHVGAIVVLLAAACMIAAGTGGQGSVMHDMFIRDGIADVLKISLLVVSAVALGFAWTFMQIGRAHVRTPVTNAHLVCRLLLEKKKQENI